MRQKINALDFTVYEGECSKHSFTSNAWYIIRAKHIKSQWFLCDFNHSFLEGACRVSYVSELQKSWKLIAYRKPFVVLSIDLSMVSVHRQSTNFDVGKIHRLFGYKPFHSFHWVKIKKNDFWSKNQVNSYSKLNLYRSCIRHCSFLLFWRTAEINNNSKNIVIFHAQLNAKPFNNNWIHFY